jgi:purine-nucleoside phosphorylase
MKFLAISRRLLVTPHIEAKKEDIAPIVLMPGDPLRAKVIAEKFLTDAQLVNSVRNMYADTGLYKGKRITVMGSGMGMASAGIYSYELFKFYDVNHIIRIGSAGSYVKDLNVYDLLLAEDAFSESTFAKVQNGTTNHIIPASTLLTKCIKETAAAMELPLRVGRVHSSDVFYQENNQFEKLVLEENCLAVEMEAFALFHNANVLNKHGASLLTISDSFVTGDATTPEERSNNFMGMVELALESTLKLGE